VETKEELDKTAKDLESRLADIETKYASLAKREKQVEEDKEALVAAASYNAGSVSNHNSDEKKALRYFGVGHVKDLIHVNTGADKFQHVPQELKYLVRQLKEDVDISRFSQQIFGGEKQDVGDSIAKVKGMLDGNYYAKHVLAPKLKAFGTGNVGEGAEWVPTLLSSSFIEEFELDRQVTGKFRQINMPGNPFQLPLQDGVTVARRQVESCDPADNIPATNFGTSQITLDAEKLVEHMCLPEELNEDSAPGILQLARSEVVEAQSRAFETAILNGDTTGPHMDSDVAGVVDARTAWKGLRKLALENSATIDMSTFDVTNLRKMRALMGKFGHSERNLIWMVSSKVYQLMLGLPEVTTVDKFGAGATILRGSLAALDGIPIVCTEYNRDDLNALGVYDGITTTQSEIKLVNASRFVWGVRRPIRTKVTMDPTPPGDRWIMASWWRGDFQGHVQSASETSVVLGIDIA